MANTTNFNWSTPDDTALVKDGAAAIRTLGSSIDTSMGDLKGGTTAQVLSKASGTDMDFSWVTPKDGELTLLSTTSISSGVTSVTVSGISSAYKTLLVEIYEVTVSGGSNATELRGYIGSTSNAHATLFSAYGENDATAGTGTRNYIALTGFPSGTAKPIKDSDSANYWSIEIPFYASTIRKSITCEGTYTRPDGNSAVVSNSGGIHYKGASPVTPAAVSALTFEATAGTFTAGTIKVYGSK
jgi:hypothetical protein